MSKRVVARSAPTRRERPPMVEAKVESAGSAGPPGGMPVETKKRARPTSPVDAEEAAPEQEPEAKSETKHPRTRGAVKAEAKTAPKRKPTNKVKNFLEGAISVYLFNEQVPAYKQSCARARKLFVLGNDSPMGAGKTPFSYALCQRFGLLPFVVATKTGQAVWREHGARYGIEPIDIITYNKLRGTEQSPPKRWITRTFREATKAQKKRAGGTVNTQEKWGVTQEMLDLIEEGIMVTFDEAQALKNNSQQTKAAQALVRAVVNSPAQRSRVILISGTLFDKEEHAEIMCRVMGIIQKRSLSRTVGGITTDLGMGELVDHCLLLDEAKTNEILDNPDVKYKPKNYRSIIYKLFVHVVRPGHFSAMPKPDVAVNLHICNAAFRPLPEEKEALETAIRRLGTAANYQAPGQELDLATVDWGRVQQAIGAIEVAKVGMFARRILGWLEANPRSKAVALFGHLAPINLLADRLAKYKPMIMVGETSEKKRKEYCDRFRHPSTKDRVLIGNTQVAGASQEFDDTDGRFPRLQLVGPSWKAIEQQQSTKRCYRAMTQSDVIVEFPYCDGDVMEVEILDRLAPKGRVMKEITSQIASEKVLFPGEYPFEYPDRTPEEQKEKMRLDEEAKLRAIELKSGGSVPIGGTMFSDYPMEEQKGGGKPLQGPFSPEQFDTLMAQLIADGFTEEEALQTIVAVAKDLAH